MGVGDSSDKYKFLSIPFSSEIFSTASWEFAESRRLFILTIKIYELLRSSKTSFRFIHHILPYPKIFSSFVIMLKVYWFFWVRLGITFLYKKIYMHTLPSYNFYKSYSNRLLTFIWKHFFINSSYRAWSFSRTSNKSFFNKA